MSKQTVSKTVLLWTRPLAALITSALLIGGCAQGTPADFDPEVSDVPAAFSSFQGILQREATSSAIPRRR